ncbi:n-acetylglutamate synthase [Xanthocytophaga agilis]|uniref:N-acetylglutamate synthase n=1 Tax=Xanthocytophaga agilis TaxID=3048010 RepID=A0AAE3UGQ7_9BACT|nr:n-acetylglutamate synthase [Xanthocytophaga agilis]MDJ1501858.1 n-acetylglutamate synthase [Xanthocytophaga agilis]
MINYHNKVFRSVNNTDNGEVSAETTFHYQQYDTIVTASYSGGSIVTGHLIALVDEVGHLNMRYHHVNNVGVLMTGICQSIPEVMENGKIRLHEKWQWTSGDYSSGESVIEEI